MTELPFEPPYEMKLNPDAEFVRNMKKKIKGNGKYCINKQKGIPENKCPCEEMRKNGNCECGLYYRAYTEYEFEFAE